MRKQIFCLVLCGLLYCPASSVGAEDLVNLLSLQQGCIPVIVPPCYGGWEAEKLLDDSSSSGWASGQGQTAGNVFVFELLDGATMERLEFDTANVDTAGSAAKDILVEVSNQSPEAGYVPILEATLAENTDHQSFALTQPETGRWVRLTVRNNYGSSEYSELFSFKGYGRQPEKRLPVTIAGTYATDYAAFHVRQEGTTLTGCYEYDEGLLDGAIEGRMMKITWRESGGPDDTGPAIMVFSTDGQSFRGYYWNKGQEGGPPEGNWDGKKVSAEVGGCPHWAGSVGGELKRQLVSEGRARLYGIRFEFNSSRIEGESTPVLNQVVAILKEDAALKLSIEGHTDSVGGAQINQKLSEDRARSVRDYLVANGIDAARLSSVGYGMEVPVADNGTELGRAQNRRVELVSR
jgi:outer membrane protein OmpA-like peptidoglycan-associated protein